MRVFVAGASGAIGKRLVPQLVERGYEVVGAFRNPEHAERVKSMGAEPVVLDLLDAPAVRRAVLESKPEGIIHQATALSGKFDFRHIDRTFAQTNRLRTQGTDNLLVAAREARVRRFVAQSYASYRYARTGGFVKTEEDPLDPSPPAAMSEIYSAMNYLDDAVTKAGGVALRYGGFYGDPVDALVEAVHKRMFPIVGNGGAYASFIHLEDAAAASILALEREAVGIFNIVDDEPAPAREWLPYLAKTVGAKPPRHFPAWLARMFGGELAVAMGTELRAASNAKAKRELGLSLRYPSWRQGFVATYSRNVKPNPSNGFAH